MTPGSGVEEMNEESPEPRDGNLVGMVGIVCICFCAFATPVDCQKVEKARTKHNPSLFSSYSHRHCCLALFAIARWLLCLL